MGKLFLVLTILLNLSLNAYQYKKDVLQADKLVTMLVNEFLKSSDFQALQNDTLAVSSFVPLNDFKESKKLSNILGENFIHRLQKLGYTIVDYKRVENYYGAAQENYLFNNELTKLKNNFNINYILTGTYIRYKSGLVINARVIDLKSYVVVSSVQIFVSKYIINNILRK